LIRSFNIYETDMQYTIKSVVGAVRTAASVIDMVVEDTRSRRNPDTKLVRTL